METSVCHDSNQNFGQINKIKNVHNVHLTIYPSIKFDEKNLAVFKLSQVHNLSHYKSMEQKTQVDIATKIYTG